MAESHSLEKQFSLPAAVAIIVGQVIGVGIFLVPAGMAKSLGSPFWLGAVWIAVSLMTLCGALCYAELAARFPEAGGSYVYLREAFGKGTAFLYGWMVMLVLDPGLTAIFGVGFAAYFSFLVPMPETARPWVSIAVVVIIGAISIAGTRIGTGFLKVLTFIKIGTLLFIVVYGFGSGSGDWSNLTPFYSVPEDMYAAMAGGLTGAFFAFAGWWEVTRIAGEVKDPKRNVPLTLIAGVVMLSVLYIAVSFVFMYLVPAGSVTNDEAFAALAGTALFGEMGGRIFALIVVFSIVGTLFAYIIASPRVYYAMARDGLFFTSVGAVHPKLGTPHRATIIQVVLASVLILTGSFDQILSYFFFMVILFVGIAVAGLAVIRKQPFEGYRTPLYPLPMVVYVLLTVVMLYFVGMQNPVQTAVGVGIVLLGIPVYYFVFDSRSRVGDEV